MGARLWRDSDDFDQYQPELSLRYVSVARAICKLNPLVETVFSRSKCGTVTVRSESVLKRSRSPIF